MEYFNAGGGGSTGNGSTDPYAVIPQQFGNGGQQPQQQVFTDYQQDGSATDYETYQQQQQQYRAAQASQQSSSMYYQNQMTAAQANYFPIHSASEHDFLGPQQPPSATTSVSGAAGAPYQSASGGNKEFMMQHQQRRGNQSGQQQQNQPSQQNNQQQQNQGARQQHPQQMQQQQQSNQSAHFMHQQLQAVQQQQAQQMHHRLQGAPINPQQFMVPPPTMMQPQQMQQAQQQQAQQMHQMQIHHQQHPQMMQQHAQQGYHPHQQNQQHQAGQHQQSHHQSQNHNQHRNHNQSHSGPHHIPQNLMMPRCMLKDWPIRCVVEGKYHAVIIGPNGSTIKDIASSTRCRVDFVNLSKKERTVLGNNDRILTVHGVAEQATKAVARILDVIQSEAVKDDVNVGADTVLRMRAHNQLCGRLIGKAGSSIKEIMQKTGTNITVTKYIEPPGGISGLTANELLGLMERTIMVRGPSIEAVVQAEALISAKLKKCYESDSQLRAQSMQCPMPPMMMPPILPPGASSSAVSAPHFIPTPPGVLQIQPGTTNLRQVRMWVPDSMIGALIGAKGKNIKMIIRDTGASVKIEAPEEKTQREAEEAEKKRKLDETDSGCEGVASGDHPQEFLEDNATINSSDAIEEKPKPVSERMVTINGDDLQLLKAQSYVFSKIAETSSSLPSSGMDGDRSHMLRIRTEVSVPTRIIGRIIGKGGQNVRELQRITGAVVKIPEEERNGGEVYRHDDGLEEDMTMIRTIGNMYSTHNVQFRLAHLVNEYYRSGDHRNKSSDYKGGRPHSAPSSGQEKDGSALEKMDQLGTIAPISNSNRASPKSVSPPKSKSP
ncbi:K Homology domain-containing protein [Caenorhabditis elegans]|uniref:K Homology domain-containing protein n=1 Tax=Caenorhabditis elegans TaxID=6239 RepID=Q21605_CAEEL|nr:K Homology domain-containing protein [Caenorhabditis elegans]CAA84338.2 K Homology domain-containing protein [Caenorhabditis elegans]|eukprot:NP_001022695.1 IMP Homolog [Caenorhabditis elegans]